jgi:hypothetical protein
MIIDHIVYAVSDLETGINELEHLFGVRAAIGGRHPDFGTHNALLSIGPETYLEIIAPDPKLAVPDQGFMFGIKDNQDPRIATWALQSNSIEEQADAAIAAGIQLGAVESGSRLAPDGTVLTWQLTDPYAMPHDGAVPFLISWGDTPHPAGATPHAGELIDFRIEHPDAESVRRAISVLGMDIDVQQSDAYRLVARLKTKNGIVKLS